MIYEYRCNKCGGTMEVERAMTDAEAAPMCCDTQTVRVWNSPSISFKGTGFYSTDNRK